jgi:hypothetical protein
VAKGKKEDPNKVAQRKAARVAFVKSNPQLAPEVARKRYYVQTRAAELEAAGKPVDRAALRKKFETGGVTREGFYTPADLNRIAARNASLADSKTTPTTSTTTPTPSTKSVVPPKTNTVVTPTTSTTVPKTGTTVPPTSQKPVSGQMPRIADRVNQNASRATSMAPDTAAARANVPKPDKPIYNTKPGTDVPTNPFLRAFYEVGKFTVGGVESAKASFVNPLLNTVGEFKASVEDFKANPSWKTAWSGGSKLQEAKTNPKYRKSSAAEDVMNALVALPPGTGRAIAGATSKGLGKIGATGASRYIDALLKVTAKNPAIAALPAVEKPALPAAGYTGKQGRVRLAEEARIAAINEERVASRGWGAGESPMPDLPSATPKSRLEKAAELQKQREAAVAAARQEAAPSLHDIKQADLQAMVDETPLNIEKPTTTKGKGKGKGKTKVDKLINEQGGAVEPGFEYGPTMPREMKVTDVVETPKPTKGKGKKTKTKVEVKASEVVDDFEFDASIMEMGSTERMAGDAYLYNPADDIAAENLASIKAKQEPVLAPEPAVTEKPKSKGKSKKTTQVEIKAEEPAPKPVKKKQETKPARHKVGDLQVVMPEGAKPQRQTIAPDIEIKGKQGTVSGQTRMGQAASRDLPVEGEIPNVLSLAEQKTASTRRTVKIAGIDVVIEGSGTLADPTRVVGRPLKGESMLEVQFPREAPTGTPRRMPEPPAEKISPKPEKAARRRGVIKVEPYQPPAGEPVRITREQANRAVRVREQIAKELEKDPFGTGTPRPIRSSMGNLPETAGGLTERQIMSKGGRPKKNVKETFTTVEEKAQAAIEMTMSGTDKAMSVAEIKAMAFEDINRISRWLTKKRMQSVAANPEAPSTALDNLREIIGQAKASRMIENAAEFEATGGQQKYFDMVTNPRSSAKRPTAESKAAEAEGKLISDINDINAKAARSGSKSGPTPESNKRLLSTHMPTIERLEPKVKSGTATEAQIMELGAAYESMMRGMATGSAKESWYKKIKWLQGMMEKY